jgi:predicted thioredoxin/glutaredoxin
MTYDEQMKTINAPVRAIHDAKNWTVAQRDSISTEDIKDMEQEIKRKDAEYWKEYNRKYRSNKLTQK